MASADPRIKSRSVSFALLIGVWLLAELLWVRPEAIGASWREVDTQAIARNFHREGIHPLYPRIDWRGDGPGFVETEFPLYATAIALGMRVFGEVEWLGQVLSILFGAGAAGVLFAFLRRRHGELPALCGAGLLLSAPLWISLSVSVMPDMASLFFAVVGVVAFARYAEGGSLRSLGLASTATAVAALLKASALAVGVVQFLLLALGARQRLKSAGPWLGFAFVLAVSGAHLWHANGLYRDYGNTFGVLSGGDTKFPSLGMLLSPRVHLDLAWMVWHHGPGPIGLAALALLVLLRRLGSLEAALLLGYLFGVYVSLGYSADRWAGPHYHVLGVVAGAVWTAAAAAEVLGRVPSLGQARSRAWIVALVLGILGLRLTVHGLDERTRRGPLEHADSVLLGRALAPRLLPTDRIVVRSPKPTLHPTWNRPSNFEEPTVFYAADAKGYSVAADRVEPLVLEELVARGADFYVEAGERLEAPELYQWLDEAAELQEDAPFGRIWKLLPKTEPEVGP